MATQQLEDALLSIEARPAEENTVFIILGHGGEIRVLSDSDRGTVTNSVMKRLKATEEGIVKVTSASALLNMVLHGSWPVATPEVEEAAEEVGTDTNSDEESTIWQPPAASSCTPDPTAAILQQMKALTALLQKQGSNIEQLEQRRTRGGGQPT